jgi:hypothetical protein
MRRSIGTAAAVAVVLATGGMTATAWADESTPSTSGTSATATGTGTGTDQEPDWDARFDRVCKRVDKQLKRAGKVQARLAADASSRGSLAFLQARIDRAEQAGQDDLAKVLGLRLQLRRQVADQLPHRVDLLEQAQQTCQQAGK